MTDATSYAPTADDKNFAMLAHLALLSWLLTAGIGFILGPLIVWLIKKDGSPFVDRHGKEAVNFGITYVLWTIIGAVCFFTIILIPVALVIWIGGAIAAIVLPIVAGLRAKDGGEYRYPLTFRLLS